MDAAHAIPSRYRVVRRLGAGGMGAVYLVDEVGAGGGAPLALKTCSLDGVGEASGDPVSRIERFRREFLALSRLRHPSLPRVRDFGCPNGGGAGAWYFTYDFVAGADLVEWSDGRRPQELLAVARQLVGALTLLHSRGLLHLDVKPANIIVEDTSEGPRAKLIDFGIARRDGPTSAPADHGSLPYMPPEVLRGRPPGLATDYYGLGVSLFEALFRQRPYEGRSLRDLRRAHAARLPAPPPGSGDRRHEELESLIWRLLSRDPARRAPGLERESSAARETLRSYVLSNRPVALEGALSRLWSDFAGLEGARPGPMLVVVEGEAGAGKTRLLEELKDMVQVAGGRFVLVAAPDDEGRAASVGEALATALLAHAERGAARTFEAHVRRAPTDPLWESEYGAVRSEQERVRHLEALRSLLEAALDGGPAVLAVDAADARGATVDELLALAGAFATRDPCGREQTTPGASATRAETPRILLCVTCRDAARLGLDTTSGAALEGRTGLRCERLEPLERGAVRELVASVFACRAVPDEVVAALHDTSGGNPLVIVETLKSLVDSGALVCHSARDLEVREPPSRWGVPRGAAKVLEARWLAARDDERRLASCLAVGPSLVSASLVHAVSPFPRARTRELLDALEDRSLLVRAGRGRAYRFRHPSFRALAGATLSAAEQRRLHGILASRAQRAGADAGDVAVLLAEAGDGAAAARHALELACSSVTSTRLARVLERVLDVLSPGDDAYAEVAEALGEALSLLGDHERSAELFESALRATPAADGVRTARRLMLAAAESVFLGRSDTARERYEKAQALLETSGAPAREWLRARLGLCRVEIESGDTAAAESIARACLTTLLEQRVADDDPDPEHRLLECVTRSRLGSLLVTRGALDEAVDCYERAAALIAKLPDSLEKGALWCNTANLYSARGDSRRATRFYTRALGVAARVGARDLEALAGANLGLQHLYRWDLADAESCIERARRVAERVIARTPMSGGTGSGGSARYASFAELCRGTLLVRWGKLEAAEASLVEEHERCVRRGDDTLAVNLAHQLVLAQVGRGRLADALALARSSARRARGIGRPKARVESRLVRSIVLFHLAEPRRARRLLETVLDSPGARHPHVEAELRFWLGRYAVAAGELADGVAHLEHARGAFRRLGIAPRECECHAHLGAAYEAQGRRAHALRASDRAWRFLTRLRREERPVLIWAAVALERARLLETRLAAEDPRGFELRYELAEARAALGRNGCELVAWPLAVELARLSRHHGDDDRAKELIAEARARCERLSATLPAPRADALRRSPDALRLAETAEAIESRAAASSTAHVGDLEERVRRLEAAQEALLRENATLRADAEHLRRSAETQRVTRTATQRREGRVGPSAFHGIVGASAPMERLFALMERAAASELPVLVRGETGSGKDLVVAALHRLGARRDRPLVTLALGAMPEALVESELFGHAAGAYTGAVAERAGLVVASDGGTLYLADVDELSLAVQAKLLRVLQSGCMRPLGSDAPVAVDFRLLASTRADLAERADDGLFREDLAYRLRGVELVVPPLRERREDIPLLVSHFLGVEAERAGRRMRLDAGALEKLESYDWPGNVRELENELRRVAVLGAERVRAVDLLAHAEEATRRAASPDSTSGVLADGVLRRTGWTEAREALDRAYFEDAIERCGGNLRAVARELGVHERTVYKIRKRLGLEGNGDAT